MTSYKVKEVALNSNERMARAFAREIAEAFSGRFRIVEPLGHSDESACFLAEDLSVPGEDDASRLVRLEVLSDAAARNPELVNLFQLESRAASSLSHRNILSAGGDEQMGGYHFRVVEHIPGAGTLRGLLNVKGWLDAELASGIAMQVARALAEAHKEGVLHLKICPERILLLPDGDVQLAGFGIEARSDLKWAHDLRSDRCPVAYASPEQGDGLPVDHRSDLYSLGVVLFEALTDRVPFNAENPERIRLKHRTQSPLPPNVYCESVPKELSALVMRLLEKRPEDRLESASELQRALAKFAPAALLDPEPEPEPEPEISPEISLDAISPATAQAAFIGAPGALDSDFDIEPLGNLLPELELKPEEIPEVEEAEAIRKVAEPEAVAMPEAIATPEVVATPSGAMPEPEEGESKDRRRAANNERIAEKIRVATIIEPPEIEAPVIEAQEIESQAIEPPQAQSVEESNNSVRPSPRTLITVPEIILPDAPREAELAVADRPSEPAAYLDARATEPARLKGGRRWLAVAAIVALCVAAIAFANRSMNRASGSPPENSTGQPREAGTFVPTPASVADPASKKAAEAKPAEERSATPRADSVAPSSRSGASARPAARKPSARRARSRVKRSARQRETRRVRTPGYNPRYN